jgi:ribosomal protein L29
MGVMTPKARRILSDAFATLDRTADIPTPDDELDPEVSEYIELCCLEPDWEPPAPRLRKKRDTVATSSASDWDDWLGARLNKFAEEYSNEIVRVTFSRMDRFKKASDAQIAQLEATVRELRAEVFTLREMIKSGGSSIVRSEATPRRTIDIN